MNKIYLENLLDYELVERGTECAGSGRSQGEKETLEACAASCRSSAQLFVYGTREFGTSKCSIKKCECWCQDETENRKCKNTISNAGFNLYKFNGKLDKDSYDKICT